MFSRLAHQPGEGLLILEQQQKILAFLVECSESILHDIPPTSIFDDEFSIKPDLGPIIDGAEYPTLATLATEAPYRLPAQLDLSKLKSLIAARRSDAENHIWALREDPYVFPTFSLYF